MADRELEQLVSELRTMLDDPDEIDREERAQLVSLAARIDEHVQELDDGLVDRIQDAITEFEVSHPTLTRILNRIADSLSAGGL